MNSIDKTFIIICLKKTKTILIYWPKFYLHHCLKFCFSPIISMQPESSPGKEGREEKKRPKE